VTLVFLAIAAIAVAPPYWWLSIAAVVVYLVRDNLRELAPGRTS
jgi:hypothetical protein